MPKKPRLFILDANALLHRAWHALPMLTAPDGQVVNAVYGVFAVITKALEEHAPDAMVACWDTEAPTFRHIAYEAYKAHREEQPKELYAQVPLIKEGFAALGIPSVELDGYEADDLLGTLAMRGRNMGWEITIVTSDRDALQLVGQDICVLAFKKGMSETILYDETEIERQYGLASQQFVAFKALRGDASDNIPGIKGIGEKTATALLQKYHTLEGVFRAAHEAASDLPVGLRKRLLEGEASMPEMLKLVTIDTDVPIEWKPKATAFPAHADELRAFFLRMGFRSLIKKMDATITGAPIEEEHTSKPEKREKRVSEYEDLEIEDERAALSLMEEARCHDGVVVRVARGTEGTLFARDIEGIAFGIGRRIFLIRSALMKKSDAVRRIVHAYVEDPALPKIMHDAKREAHALMTMGATLRGLALDTMLAGYLLGAGDRDHDLPTLAMRYAFYACEKEASVFRQVEAILRLGSPLRAALEETGARSVLGRFELPLVPILFGMERVGIRIDAPYLRQLSQELTKEKKTLEKKMQSAAGRAFNPASPGQLAEILFEELNLPTKGIKKGKTGFSTAAPELEKLRGLHPLVDMVDQYRELSKMLSTYVDVLPAMAGVDGRVHTTFNQAVTATGRLSSSDPNLQNIPIRTELGRRIRHAFVSDPGFVLLSCDYSQIELRVVAALAQDQKMLAAFRRNEDIHTATAAAIWKTPAERITKDQRRIAKAINFGLIFGQGPQGLAQVSGISVAEAKVFIAAYFDEYQGIKKYMDETKALAHRLGYVETLFGRRRFLPDIHSPAPQLRAQAERMAVNMPVQGTDADLIKLAMIAVANILPDLSFRSRMLLQVHDELLFEVPETEIEHVAATLKETMEQVEKIGVPIIVDTKVGTNWDEMKSIIFSTSG